MLKLHGWILIKLFFSVMWLYVSVSFHFHWFVLWTEVIVCWFCFNFLIYILTDKHCVLELPFFHFSNEEFQNFVQLKHQHFLQLRHVKEGDVLLSQLLFVGMISFYHMEFLWQAQSLFERKRLELLLHLSKQWLVSGLKGDENCNLSCLT